MVIVMRLPTSLGRRAGKLAGKARDWSTRQYQRQAKSDEREKSLHASRSIPHVPPLSSHSDVLRRRSAFPITETELNVIAALAIIGLSSRPKTGYSTPAAIGTPSTL